MLGGRTPFTGDLMQLIMQKIMHRPAPLSTIRTDIPADVERVVMTALEINPADRPTSVSQWIEELENAAEDVDESREGGRSRLVVLAPVNSEVYIDDERKGSIGSSGRVVLSGIAIGRHILRVSRAGERDDERVIEVREGSDEQVIQAQLKPSHGTGSQPSSSQGNSSNSSVLPGIVACANCGSRFAEGVRFCGRCGSTNFVLISAGETPSGFPCPRCRANLPEKSKFCGRCGLSIVPATSPNPTGPVNFTSSVQTSPRQAERVCRRCGSVYPANIRYCGRCGGSLS